MKVIKTIKTIFQVIAQVAVAFIFYFAAKRNEEGLKKDE